MLDLVGRCRIVRRGQQNQAISDFRLVLLFAAPCRDLLHSKGKERATFRRRFPKSYVAEPASLS
jgi:hypothetical protein